jgi:hypothetical protein
MLAFQLLWSRTRGSVSVSGIKVVSLVGPTSLHIRADG